jgi:hypothetical protein
MSDIELQVYPSWVSQMTAFFQGKRVTEKDDPPESLDGEDILKATRDVATRLR